MTSLIVVKEKRMLGLRMKWILMLVLGMAIGINAEPYFAARTGFKCAQCHVNRTGGGKRTEYGLVYSQYKLLMANAMSQKQAFSFDPKISNSISVGANLRVEPVYTLAYSTQKVNATDSAKALGSNFTSTNIKESNFYMQVDLVKDFLTYYTDISGGTIREMWGMLNVTPSLYLKTGYTLLPYGIRLMDDQAFIRNGTGYTYGTVAPSFEVGYEPGPFSFIVNANDAKISSVGYVVLNMPFFIRTLRIGGSHSLSVKKAERRLNNSKGMFAMASMGMFTFLGEYDMTKMNGVNKIEEYFEMDFLPMQGLNFKGVYEWMTPDKTLQGHNGQQRITVGIEPSLFQFLQIGLYYRKNDFVPQAGAENQDQVVGRVQVYF